jgi:hypothetical protein
VENKQNDNDILLPSHDSAQNCKAPFQFPPPNMLNFKFIQKNTTEIECLKSKIKTYESNFELLYQQVEEINHNLKRIRPKTTSQNNVKKPRSSISEEAISEFMHLWESQYVCLDHISEQGCTKTSAKCRYLHDSTASNILRSELKLIAEGGRLHCSTIFSRLYESAHTDNMGCISKANDMRLKIEEICNLDRIELLQSFE